MKAGSSTKQAEIMLRSIEKIGQDMTTRDNVGRTREITEKLKENRKKFSDILTSSYDEAFNIPK